MVAFNFLCFCFCITLGTINCAKSDINSNKTQIELTTEWPNKAFVATTPVIKINLEKDDSEEDDDDDDNSLMEHTDANDNNPVNAFKPNPLALIFNTISNAMIKSAINGMRKNSKSTTKSNEYDGDDVTEKALANNDTTATFQGRQAGASYIKGDPLNGYYDFVITEGSYKFWVVFQLFTAALLIYSTLAAIYYSKVNPLTSDYDYIDYLSRSFKGRSLDSEDLDPEGDDFSVSKHSYLSSLEHNKWVKTAAYGFQFAMDAIDRIPK